MNNWRIDPEARRFLYSPIGLRLVDDLTGVAPIGEVRTTLLIRDAGGQWQKTDVEPVITASGVWTFPRLGFHANVTGQVQQRYKVQFEADYYIPEYRGNTDGIEFDVFPYNHNNPPQQVAAIAQDVILMPASSYPYRAELRVLRGFVEDNTQTRIGDVLVTEGNRERVLTNDNGEFGLPLRWPQNNVQVLIDAVDQRTGRSGSIPITLPDALASGKTITIQ